MSGQEQKSAKLSSDLNRNQTAPRKGPMKEKSRGRPSTSAQRMRVQGTIEKIPGRASPSPQRQRVSPDTKEKNRGRASTSAPRITITQGTIEKIRGRPSTSAQRIRVQGTIENSRGRASTSVQRKTVTQGTIQKIRWRPPTSAQRIRVQGTIENSRGRASRSAQRIGVQETKEKSPGRASTSVQRKTVAQGTIEKIRGRPSTSAQRITVQGTIEKSRGRPSTSAQRIIVTQATIQNSSGRASRSTERVRVTQGTMGMARGSEHNNVNDFVNKSSSKGKGTLAMSTHTPQMPTAPEMPTTSFAEQNASTPTAKTEAGCHYFELYVEANISPRLTSNTAATTGSCAASIAHSDSRAQSSTVYSFPRSALGSESTAHINGARNDVETEQANNEEETVIDSIYECNICLTTAKNPVLSLCGHLFCWPCLHQWLETRSNCELCPVCKAVIEKNKVIALYGRNSTKQEDPRNYVPPRPTVQRSEPPEPQQGSQLFEFANAFDISFGIGTIPFGFIVSSFNLGRARPTAANGQRLSKLFLYLAFLYIAYYLFVSQL